MFLLFLLIFTGTGCEIGEDGGRIRGQDTGDERWDMQAGDRKYRVQHHHWLARTLLSGTIIMN